MKRIRRHRERLGLSRRALAERAQCTEQTLKNVEALDWASPTQGRIRAGIAEALGVSERLLFTMKGVSR